MHRLLLFAAILAAALAEPCVNPPKKFQKDCPFDPMNCYKLLKSLTGRGLCWPEAPWIDTQTCGGEYLDIRRVRENPCEDPDAPDCVWVEAFYNSKYWVVPNPWHEDRVAQLSDQMVLGPPRRSEFLSMTEAAFCNRENWSS